MNEQRHRWQAVVAALAVMVLAVALVAGPVGCGGGGANVDPQKVLTDSSTKMKAIKGFHFVYEVHKPQSTQPGTGFDISRITGDVNAQGYMQATVDAKFSGVPITVGFVAMGDTQYIQNPLSKTWEKISIDQSPVGSLSLSAGTIQILDHIAGASNKGEENRAGAKCYHITGTVAAEQVKAIAGAVDTTNNFPTDIWIGVNDSYVYEVDIAGAATGNEDPKTTRSIVLSNLNQSVTVTAPQ